MSGCAVEEIKSAKRGDTKRITIFVDSDIDVIREHMQNQLGVRLTYVQLFDYLINYYRKNSSIPKTQWKKD